MADALARCSASRQALRQGAGPGGAGSHDTALRPEWVGTRSPRSGRHLVCFAGRRLSLAVRADPFGFLCEGAGCLGMPRNSRIEGGNLGGGTENITRVIKGRLQIKAH